LLFFSLLQTVHQGPGLIAVITGVWVTGGAIGGGGLGWQYEV